MSKLTEVQKNSIRYLWDQHLTHSDIARDLKLPRSTVRDYLGRAEMDPPPPTPHPTVPESVSHPLDVPVRPLYLTLPPFVPKGEGNVTTALLWGDSHFPDHDPAALSIVRQIAQDLQPDTLVHMGDLLDCYSLSRFDKNPSRLTTLQAEITAARLHLAAMKQACPQSRFLFLEGNHEDRLRRTLWNLEGTAAALLSLDLMRDSMTWPTLLGLDQLAIEFYPYNEQTQQVLLPKWLLKHGTVVRTASGATARGEHDKYGMSGASGHTHRLGVYFRRDHNGNHCWVETGCTCRLNPEYAQDPDWQQGCVVLTFDRTTGAFQQEPIYIHNGRAVWRGRIYVAD